VIRVVPFEEIAKRFYGATDRAWFVDDYAPYIATSYTLWSAEGSGRNRDRPRLTFAQLAANPRRRRGLVGSGHMKDAQAYCTRMRKQPGALPPILVDIFADGKRVVSDGNRRALAYMLLAPPERERVQMPAYVVDHREVPW